MPDVTAPPISRLAIPVTHRPLPGDRLCSARGVTLVELMLAVAVTGVVGLASGALLSAVHAGSNRQTDLRALVVRHKTISTRLGVALRSSRMVLYKDDTRALLWTTDRRVNTSPDLSELRLIESANDELVSYRVVFPPSWSQAQYLAAETTYQFSSSPTTMMNTVKNHAEVERVVWGRGISSMSLTLDVPDAKVQEARLIGYRLQLTNGNLTDEAIGAAALRNSQ